MPLPCPLMRLSWRKSEASIRIPWQKATACSLPRKHASFTCKTCPNPPKPTQPV
jgi:hypothetical protein